MWKARVKCRSPRSRSRPCRPMTPRSGRLFENKLIGAGPKLFRTVAGEARLRADRPLRRRRAGTDRLLGRRRRAPRRRRDRLHVHAGGHHQPQDPDRGHRDVVDHAARRHHRHDRVRPDDQLRHDGAGRSRRGRPPDAAAGHEGVVDVSLPHRRRRQRWHLHQPRLHGDDRRAAQRPVDPDGHGPRRQQARARVPDHRAIHTHRRSGGRHPRSSWTATATTCGGTSWTATSAARA